MSPVSATLTPMSALTPIDPPSLPALVGRLCRTYWRRWSDRCPTVRLSALGRSALSEFIIIDAVAFGAGIALSLSLPWMLFLLVFSVGDTARRCFALGPSLEKQRELAAPSESAHM